MICLMPKPSQSFFVYHIQSKEKNFKEKVLLKKRRSIGLNKKQKESFLIALTMMIKKDSATSIWKHANVFKNCEDSN